MTALLITVETPENGQTTYRFEDSRVRVGRRKDCDLCICHEAMSRELCVAWVEDDACTVRVEERPHLTNPLIKGKNIVAGGASGKRMVFTVGPITLRFEAGDGNAQLASDKKNNLTKGLIFAAPGAILVVLAAVFFGGTKGDSSHEETVSTFPDDPFCSVKADQCDSPESCMERARLLITRARDLNSRPGGNMRHRVRAAAFLRRAVSLYSASNSPLVHLLEQKASRSEEAISTAYRRDVMILREAVRRGRQDAEIGEAADRVSAYLGHCHGRELAWLQSLQVNQPPRLEEL